jgi:hypothetical protein
LILVGLLCAAACAAPLAVVPNTTYDPNSEATVMLFGQPVGKYVDDQHPDQCAAVAAERAEWPIVLAGVFDPARSCANATLNVREWYPWWGPSAGLWGPVAPAQAYILQGNTTAKRRAVMLRQAERWNPELVLWYSVRPFGQ